MSWSSIRLMNHDSPNADDKEVGLNVNFVDAFLLFLCISNGITLKLESVLAYTFFVWLGVSLVAFKAVD